MDNHHEETINIWRGFCYFRVVCSGISLHA